MYDIVDDVVFSFRANIDDITLDQWKAISGGYDSRLFAFTMQEIIQEYNVEQLRDIQSIPLNLNAREKELAIDILVKTYWEYQGEYKFFTNNCAHETQKVLAAIYIIIQFLNKLKDQVNSATNISYFGMNFTHGRIIRFCQTF